MGDTQLYPDQAKTLRRELEKGTGVVEAPMGSGKTIMSYYNMIVTNMKRKREQHIKDFNDNFLYKDQLGILYIQKEELGREENDENRFYYTTIEGVRVDVSNKTLKPFIKKSGQLVGPNFEVYETNGVSLVVCDKANIGTWVDELKKHFSNESQLKCQVYYKDTDYLTQKEFDYFEPEEDINVIITTYDVLSSLLKKDPEMLDRFMRQTNTFPPVFYYKCPDPNEIYGSKKRMVVPEDSRKYEVYMKKQIELEKLRKASSKSPKKSISKSPKKKEESESENESSSNESESESSTSSPKRKSKRSKYVEIEDYSYIYGNVFNVVFFDEVHNKCSITTNWCRAGCCISAAYKWGLSGTPIRDPKPDIMFGIYTLTKLPFTDRLAEAEAYMKSTKFKGTLHDFVVTTRDDYSFLKELPEIEKIIKYNDVSKNESLFIQLMKDIFYEYAKKSKDDTLTNKEKNYFRTSYLAVLGYLRQACLSPLMAYYSIEKNYKKKEEVLKKKIRDRGDEIDEENENMSESDEIKEVSDVDDSSGSEEEMPKKSKKKSKKKDDDESEESEGSREALERPQESSRTRRGEEMPEKSKKKKSSKTLSKRIDKMKKDFEELDKEVDKLKVEEKAANVIQTSELDEFGDKAKFHVEILRLMKEKVNELGLKEYIENKENFLSSRFKSTFEVLLKHKDEKRIIVCTSREALILLKKLIEADENLNDAEVLHLDSKHKAGERNDIIKNFKESENDILLFTYKIGAAGLNLQVANVMIILDFWWNSVDQDQAIARVYRQGQKRKVFVYLLIGNSGIENLILEKQKEKIDIIDKLSIGEYSKKNKKKTDIGKIVFELIEKEKSEDALRYLLKTTAIGGKKKK